MRRKKRRQPRSPPRRPSERSDRAAPAGRHEGRSLSTCHRERIVYPAPCACPECGGPVRRLGEDVTETLDCEPRRWKVVEHVREKVSCRACETVSQPPAPSHPIARGRAGPNLLALVLAAKYGQHLPLTFERHARDLLGRPDFVFRDPRLAAFVDGDFWHGWHFSVWRDKLSAAWEAKIETNRRRDLRNFRRARYHGWEVIRLREHQIMRDPEACVHRIAEALGVARDKRPEACGAEQAGSS